MTVHILVEVLASRRAAAPRHPRVARACWLPIARGLTPHGLRHSYKTLMEELGMPGKLMDHQMGHADGSIQAVYSHVTAGMRQRLMDGLTELWGAALAARRTMAPGSPVAVLDRLLRKDADMVAQDRLPRFSRAAREKREGRSPCLGNPASELRKLRVGDTGIEPVTSSVSATVHPGPRPAQTRGAAGQAETLQALQRRLDTFSAVRSEPMLPFRSPDPPDSAGGSCAVLLRPGPLLCVSDNAGTTCPGSRTVAALGPRPDCRRR
jgi:hypothetical protein